MIQVGFCTKSVIRACSLTNDTCLILNQVTSLYAGLMSGGPAVELIEDIKCPDLLTRCAAEVFSRIQFQLLFWKSDRRIALFSIYALARSLNPPVQTRCLPPSRCQKLHT